MEKLWYAIKALASTMKKSLGVVKEDFACYLHLSLKCWFTLKSTHASFDIEGFDTFTTKSY